LGLGTAITDEGQEVVGQALQGPLLLSVFTAELLWGVEFGKAMRAFEGCASLLE